MTRKDEEFIWQLEADGKLERAYSDYKDNWKEFGIIAPLRQMKLTDSEFRRICKILIKEGPDTKFVFQIVDYEIGVRVMLTYSHAWTYNLNDTTHFRFSGDGWDVGCYQYMIDFHAIHNDGIEIYKGDKCRTLKKFLNEVKEYLEERTADF